jgi:hypothetical protein
VLFDGQRRIRRELLARLVDPPPGAADNPGEDQRLRLRPAFGQALVDKKLIGTLLCDSYRRHDSKRINLSSFRDVLSRPARLRGNSV